jgi:uncharacterized protein (TIGR02757 family)
VKSKQDIKLFLEEKYKEFNTLDFIPKDPISIPKQFQKKEDIEIIGFLIALISWGQRKSILKSGQRLVELFHNSPYDFIINHQDSDLKSCHSFVHRTFNGDDLISLIAFLKLIYIEHGGLEQAFSKHLQSNDKNIENCINGFVGLYLDSDVCLQRTVKHLARPSRGSACKRINMFLRWMVRSDESEVDFGLWKSISPSQLVCPLDVHVIREAQELGLMKSDKSDWKTAIELTEKLKQFDKEDPVKYDFALFGYGEFKKQLNLVSLNNLK